MRNYWTESSQLSPISYAIRMSHKAGYAPANFYEYTVYPLEGVWDITEEAKKNYTGDLDKDTLVFNLMIRQPNFVSDEFANEALQRTIKRLNRGKPLSYQYYFSSRIKNREYFIVIISVPSKSYRFLLAHSNHMSETFSLKKYLITQNPHVKIIRAYLVPA